VRDATGVVIRELPLTPERVWRALRAAEADARARAMSWTVALDDAYASTPREATVLVGGKAANLGVMTRDLGSRCRRGSRTTTAACRAFLAGGWPEGLDDELRTRMAAVESAVGRRFGDAADPLLVSVRSGAPVSMPGMMDTILDLGLNEVTTAGLARASGDEAFAAACRERFETSFPLDRRYRRGAGRSVGPAPRRDRGRSSARGTAAVPGPIGRRKGSPTTLGPA
jgi:hypothetical protein